MIRSFLGIPIPDTARESLKDIYRIFKMEKNLKPVSIDNLHITLKFLGEIREDMVNKIDKVLSSISFNNFEISLKNTGAFFNRGKPTVFFIDIFSDKLFDLFNIVETKLMVLGFNKESREFKPHLTLARIKGFVNKNVTKNFLEYKTGIISFKAEKFVLYKSDLKPEGPIYTELSTYNLI